MLFDWMPMAYTCNPSYSGGRDWEDHGSKPAHKTLSQKTLHKKYRAGGVAQGVGPEFKTGMNPVFLRVHSDCLQFYF
jgi:hypothetical protein